MVNLIPNFLTELAANRDTAPKTNRSEISSGLQVALQDMLAVISKLAIRINQTVLIFLSVHFVS